MLLLLACKRERSEQDRYLEDRAFRRKVLEASLANPKNTYSQQRLGAYALERGGWDSLPEWSPGTARVGRGEKVPDAPFWDGKRPTTQEGWEALGRRVFFDYPLRPEPLAEFALTHESLAAASGVQRDAEGIYPGLTAFMDIDGRQRVGITCALCHSTVIDGVTVPGFARRTFDYGKLRLAYHAETKSAVDPELARRMAYWGPGRADVTEDVDEDPVAIPDLWGLKEQTELTQAGTIKQVSPAALAIRQETQLLHSNHERVRPPRELAWALAMYLYSLKPPPEALPRVDVSRGAALFDRACSDCHSNAAYGGPVVDAERVGTDLALANGTARGTGTYRPPSLIRVSKAAPYLHHGAVPTLEGLFDAERLKTVPGHDYGTDWPAEDRAALIDFLRTL